MNKKNLELLREMARAHEKRERQDGTEFYVFADGVIDACGGFETWGDILDPWNDDTYKIAGFALSAILEHIDAGEDLDNWDASEFASNNTPVYNGQLLEWLSANLHNAEYVDMATDNYGAGPLYEMLSRGYMCFAEEVAIKVLNVVIKMLDEPEEVTE